MEVKRRKQKETADDLKILATAFSLRLAFIFYATIHDYYFHVNFTDVDYKVFSEGAHFVAQGKSPFLSPTYRYSPFLAWLLVPVVSFPNFGKILFCCADIAIGWLLLKIRRRQNNYFVGSDGSVAAQYDQVFDVYALWLFNPLTVIVSTRGSCDSLHGLAILASLYLLTSGNWFIAAFVHGFGAIHLRIYPVIYLPSVFLYFVYQQKSAGVCNFVKKCCSNWRGFVYLFISLLCFALIIVACYGLYDDVGVQQFFLYHFSRIDPKHNFSPYFLPIYLAQDNLKLLRIISTGAFIPQFCAVVGFALKYAHDLEFCWFLTTFAFVSFNKVCTSQYFIWYIIFTPIIANSLQIPAKKVYKMIVLWFVGQGIWLFTAYLLEFQGWNVFTLVWLTSLLFLSINCWIMVTLIRAFRTREEQQDLLRLKESKDS